MKKFINKNKKKLTTQTYLSDDEEVNKTFNIDNLPIELKLEVFSYFKTLSELNQLALVSKQWYNESNYASIWKFFHVDDRKQFNEFKKIMLTHEELTLACLHDTRHKFISCYLLGEPKHTDEIWHLPSPLDSNDHEIGSQDSSNLLFRIFSINSKTTFLIRRNDGQAFKPIQVDSNVQISNKNDKQKIIFLASVNNIHEMKFYFAQLENVRKGHGIIFLVKQDSAKNFLLLPRNSILITGNTSIVDLLRHINRLTQKDYDSQPKTKSRCNIS